MVNLSAEIVDFDVIIGFRGEDGAFGMIASVPLSDEDAYRISNTGTTEDEVAAEVAAEWMRNRFKALLG